MKNIEHFASEVIKLADMPFGQARRCDRRCDPVGEVSKYRVNSFPVLEKVLFIGGCPQTIIVHNFGI